MVTIKYLHIPQETGYSPIVTGAKLAIGISTTPGSSQ
jgi:hypothetical protein